MPAARGSRRTCTIVGRKTSWTARAATLPGSVSQSFPDVPTAKQAGLDYEVSIWAGMFAPKGTPTGIIDKLANNLDAALEEPAVKNRLADLGVSLPRNEERSPAKFASFVKSEISRWSPILKAANADSKSPGRAERSSGIGGKRQSAYQPGDLFGEFASFRTTSVAQCSSHVR